MNDEYRMTNGGCKRAGSARQRHLLFVICHWLVLALASVAAAASTNAPNTPPAKPERAPETPREFFNAGTRMLNAGKLREAEAFLQSAVGSQDERVQAKALYNLGQTRFAQGIEELKKMADGRQTAHRGRQAAARADAASHAADAALASNDVEQMVQAYRQGRGARKDLREATKAVRAALELFGNVLFKWQRAAGDFSSAAELDSANKDAAHNADIVNRRIAWLIDQIREMQQALAQMQQANQQLGEKMKQLKGRIPAPDAPPGGGGDEEEEEEETPDGLRPEMHEAAGRTGEEIKMSPEEAGQMLNGLKRDGDRRLPMGQEEQGKPRDPKRPNW